MLTTLFDDPVYIQYTAYNIYIFTMFFYSDDLLPSLASLPSRQTIHIVIQYSYSDGCVFFVWAFCYLVF